MKTTRMLSAAKRPFVAKDAKIISISEKPSSPSPRSTYLSGSATPLSSAQTLYDSAAKLHLQYTASKRLTAARAEKTFTCFRLASSRRRAAGEGGRARYERKRVRPTSPVSQTARKT
jgi:hypothetical protein